MVIIIIIILIGVRSARHERPHSSWPYFFLQTAAFTALSAGVTSIQQSAVTVSAANESVDHDARTHGMPIRDVMELGHGCAHSTDEETERNSSNSSSDTTE